MQSDLLRWNSELAGAGRLPALVRPDENRISAVELAVLFGAGACAALAVGLVKLKLGIPGHAILRATLPMAIGLAFVPRRAAGSMMGASAAVTVAAMAISGIGRFSAPSTTSLLALGPLLDLAMAGRSTRWHVYLRFIIAGLTANLAACAVAMIRGQLDGGWLQQSNSIIAPITYAASGALAGLVSAAATFRTGYRL